MAPSDTKASKKDDTGDLFEEDGLAGMEDLDDLLDDVEEDDSEGWVPKEKGEGVVGKVVKVGTTKSDFVSDGQDPNCPTITIEGAAVSASGERTPGTFRVIGYGAVLKRELIDNDIVVGDKVAIKYFGERPIKNGKFAGRPYKHFGVVKR